MTSIPGRGWYVEVTHPGSGFVHYPDVVDAERRPRVNGYPKLRLTVRKDDKWDDPAFEGADITVYKDGREQPVDVLETVEQTESGTVLEGRGGTALDERVQREVQSETTTALAEDIISTETPYQAHVDDRDDDTQSDVTLLDASTTTEFEDNTTLQDTVPIDVGGDSIDRTPLSWLREADGGGTTVDRDDFSGGIGLKMADGTTSPTLTLTPQHTIPADDIRIAFRGETLSGDGDFELEWRINNQTAGTVVPDASLNWDTASLGNQSFDESLKAGTTYDVQLEVNFFGDDSPEFDLDVFGILDGRFSFTFDNSVTPAPQDQGADEDGYLDGPERFPGGISVEVDFQESIDPIREATVRVTIDETTNDQAVSISFDRGASFDTESNSDTITRQPSDEAQTRAVPRLTLSHTAAVRDDATPRTAYESQTVNRVEVLVDTEATPVIHDRQFDGPIMDVLREIADVGDAIFEYRVAADGTQSVEWTQPGARTTDRADPIAEFQRQKTTAEQAKTVVIRGSSQRKREEEFTADHGTAVDLDESDLLVGKEVVYDPSTDRQFVGAGVDYELDAQSGTVTTQSDGDITDGQTLAIDYQYRPVATASNPNPNGRVIRRDLAAIATKRAAEQIARRIAEDLADPLVEGQIVIPADEVGWQLVDAVNYDVVPGESLEVRNIEHAPGQTVLSVGSRQSVGDIVDQIRGRLESVSGRV